MICLFYFSVWELAIAGAELALLSTLSPVLLAITPFLSWVRTREGQITMHALSFLGLASYALDRPVYRLLVVTFATAVLIIRQVVDWAGKDGYDVEYQGIRRLPLSTPHATADASIFAVMGLGLIVSSLSKHANHSNNPGMPPLTFFLKCSSDAQKYGRWSMRTQVDTTKPDLFLLLWLCMNFIHGHLMSTAIG